MPNPLDLFPIRLFFRIDLLSSSPLCWVPKKNSLFYKTYFIVIQRDNNRQKFITQNCSGTDVGIKRILFDNYCIASSNLTIFTTIHITERA